MPTSHVVSTDASKVKPEEVQIGLIVAHVELAGGAGAGGGMGGAGGDGGDDGGDGGWTASVAQMTHPLPLPELSEYHDRVSPTAILTPDGPSDVLPPLYRVPPIVI
jgi:hypothetical protein